MGEGDAHDTVIEEIYRLERFKGRITVDPIRDVMDALDNPQDEFAAIHIAGTNGKGSTAHILSRILQEAGYTVGTYTNPHLTDIRDRITVDGEQITYSEIEDHYDRIAAQNVDLSFFECTTAMAFCQFAAEDVDIAVVETGLGGRLDATNILDPTLAVITNVAKDHTNMLGETPEQIAHEKAGIIKEQTPVVSGAAGSPQTVIERIATQQNAPLHTVDSRAALIEAGSDMLALDIDGEQYETPLLAEYQVDNINTALTAVDCLDTFTVTDDAVRNALETVQVPGRMEKIADQPLVVLDGAHNPAGMERAVETFDRIRQGKTIAVVSIMDDKPYDTMLATLEDCVDLILVTEAAIDRAADPADLAASIAETDCEIIQDRTDAVVTALEIADADDTVLFTGSLYFVGDIKQTVDALWYEE